MRRRPWPIILIALTCILAPLFNIYYSSEVLDRGLLHYITLIVHTKSVFEIIAWIILPVLVGFSVIAFNDWSYYLYLGFMIAITFLCFNEWHLHPEKVHLQSLILLELLNISAIGYFLLPSVRMIYFTPQIRWWQQKPRYICNLTGTIKNSTTSVSCSIKNLSSGGILLETKGDFKQKEVFDVFFKLENIEVHSFGRVVHKGADGYGVLFLEIRSNYKEFKKILSELKNRGYRLRTELPPWTESLKDWLFTLFKTGKGLIPKPEDYRK